MFLLQGLSFYVRSVVRHADFKAPFTWEHYTFVLNGLWLWRSRQSGRFRHQRSADWTPSSAKLYLSVNSYKFRKDENKWKRGREWPIKKHLFWIGSLHVSRSPVPKAQLLFTSPFLWPQRLPIAHLSPLRCWPVVAIFLHRRTIGRSDRGLDGSFWQTPPAATRS